MNAEQSQNMVNLTIDGKPISVPAGTSVIAAAKKIGVSVPHFCWHPALPVAGVCRLCMVKIEGNPKLQIGCNTTVAEGMKVETKHQEAKEAQKWALEFHLVNHPLDCPTCDQAGECKLQDYYMKVGRYESQVQESKVLKPKALDVGPELVLDTERCILCSRCVRFEDSVTKTSSLGIFNRGDHSQIGLIEGRKIQHNYSYNLADICPVGAFTARDFRFRCRVWFLEKTTTVCPGCSTGCRVNVYRNKLEREYYRLKPELDEQVNGHWMCDYGRKMYKHCNASERIAKPMRHGNSLEWNRVGAEFSRMLREAQGGKFALVLTPQYTNEEYASVLESLKKVLGVLPKVYVWRPENENVSEFDGILFRGDRNANSKGLEIVLEKFGVKAEIVRGEMRELKSDSPDFTIVLAPELELAYGDMSSAMATFKLLSNVVYFGATKIHAGEEFAMSVPTKVFVEKNGTVVNFTGMSRHFVAKDNVFPDMLGVDAIFDAVSRQLGK